MPWCRKVKMYISNPADYCWKMAYYRIKTDGVDKDLCEDCPSNSKYIEKVFEKEENNARTEESVP